MGFFDMVVVYGLLLTGINRLGVRLEAREKRIELEEEQKIMKVLGLLEE
tara:strand:- start:267 stop:413 length:147 start_codon:yes stop_codon:yes gene_type:complete